MLMSVLASTTEQRLNAHEVHGRPLGCPHIKRVLCTGVEAPPAQSSFKKGRQSQQVQEPRWGQGDRTDGRAKLVTSEGESMAALSAAQSGSQMPTPASGKENPETPSDSASMEWEAGLWRWGRS